MPPPPPPALECPPSSRQALPASLQLHGHALRPCGCPYLGHLHKLALHRVLQGHEPRAVRRQQAAGGGFPSVGPAGFPEAPPASLIALQHPEVRKEVPLSRPGKRDKAASGPAANGYRRSGETRGGAREPVPDGRNAKGKLPQSPATSPATRGLVAACGSHPWLEHAPNIRISARRRAPLISPLHRHTLPSPCRVETPIAAPPRSSMQRPSDGGTVATAAAAPPRPPPASPSSVTRLADKLSQLTVADGGSAASAHVAWAVALLTPLTRCPPSPHPPAKMMRSGGA